MRCRWNWLVGGVALAAMAMANAPMAALAEEAAAPATSTAADPRADDPAFQQAAKLLAAIEDVLKSTAEDRSTAKKLPSKDEFLVTPIWTETKEDRQARVRTLLDSALGVVTDVPIVDLQKKVEAARKTIRDGEDRIADLKQKQLTAPKEAPLAGYLNNTVDSIQREIDEQTKTNEFSKADIATTKSEIVGALEKSGIKMAPEQLDLLLDSVLSGDLVRLVATFNAARQIDEQLAKAVQASGDNIGAARKYFAMHAALFAMLVHAQDELIRKIDETYMPRLAAIAEDIAKTRGETDKLMKEENRDDQKRTLEANRKSQEFAQKVASYYRGYLLKQREQLAIARQKASKDLRIADNTYETVEASFQLKALIRDASSSFEAIEKLEAPGFDQIFQNEELRREFENLTRKLDAPTS
jgi:phosphoenolpyruvate carboxylase